MQRAFTLGPSSSSGHISRQGAAHQRQAFASATYMGVSQSLGYLVFGAQNRISGVYIGVSIGGVGTTIVASRVTLTSCRQLSYRQCRDFDVSLKALRK